MDKKSQIKAHSLCKFQQVCTTVQISVTSSEYSVIGSKALILTWIDYKYLGGKGGGGGGQKD